jgi:hypothetical protein
VKELEIFFVKIILLQISKVFIQKESVIFVGKSIEDFSFSLADIVGEIKNSLFKSIHFPITSSLFAFLPFFKTKTLLEILLASAFINNFNDSLLKKKE